MSPEVCFLVHRWWLLAVSIHKEKGKVAPWGFYLDSDHIDEGSLHPLDPVPSQRTHLVSLQERVLAEEFRGYRHRAKILEQKPHETR